MKNISRRQFNFHSQSQTSSHVTFKSMDEIQVYDPSNESFWGVL